MELNDFKEYLLLCSRDVVDELEEFDWTEGKSRVSQWLALILEDWENVAKNLSHKEQDTVLWRIGGFPMFIGFWLYDDSSLSLAEKSALLNAAKCVTLAIPKLFSPEELMESAYYMWWDLLSHFGSREVDSLCLEILADLSLHPDGRVQYAALHGLGHLHHPGRPAVVDEYIRRHPRVKDNRWILECREGRVM